MTSDTAGFSGLRIAILTDGVAPWVMGGIQRHSRMLAVEMARSGASVSLFHSVRDPAHQADAETLKEFPGAVRSRIRSFVVDYPAPGRFPGHYIGDSWRYSARLLNRYRHEGVGADFIYAQGLTGLAFTTSRSSNSQGLPPVGVNQHGYEMFQHAADMKTSLQHMMLRGTFARLAREADCVFAFPGRIRRIVHERCGVANDRIIEIPNAVDRSWIRSERPLPTGCRRFVFVGRHERRKGVPELARAIQRFAPDDAEFQFVGPIPEHLQLRQRNVVYHGPVSDACRLQGILDGCDVMVCPSFAEGMPTVVLEGMARGLAIIATDVGATSEWVDESNGVLLAAPDVPGLYRAIRRFVDMPAAELHTLQLTSLKKSRQYEWGRVANVTLRAISDRVHA